MRHGASLILWRTEKVRCVTPIRLHHVIDDLISLLGEQHGYNIPEVTSAPDVRKWLTEEGMDFLKSIRDDKMLPDYARRLICDGYMCLYQSPDVMMYQ